MRLTKSDQVINPTARFLPRSPLAFKAAEHGQASGELQAVTKDPPSA